MRLLNRCWPALLLAAIPFLAHPAAAQSILISKGAVWKYLDKNIDPGPGWTAPAFDDSSWSSGPARLGYGGDGEVTVLSFGPDPTHKYITTYFRKSFDVSNPSAFQSLSLNLLRDDGAVVYLNGTEIRRDNMPAGTVAMNTLASATVGGTDEQTYFPSNVPSGLLVAGKNTLAVEIHQANQTSSDISLDLELRAANLPPVISISQPADHSTFAAGTDISLSANASDPDGTTVRVQFLQSSNLLGEAASPPYTFVWRAVPDGSYTITAVAIDADGATTTSSAVHLTVVDSNPPTLVAAVAGSSSIIVTFSKAVSAATAANINNFKTDPALVISSAALGSSPNTVVLSTSPIQPGSDFKLIVSGIQDLAGNTIATGSAISFSFSPYAGGDIDSPATPGVLQMINGAYILTGEGTDIGGASDQGFFAQQSVSGDFDYATRLASLSPSDPWAKAGLLARETLDPTSRFAAVFATPILGGALFESRSTAAAAATSTGSAPVNYPNTWLRLKRTGSSIYGYSSFDGRTWTLLGTTSLALPATIYVGMAVTSHQPGRTATAEFAEIGPSKISTSLPDPLPWEPLGPSSRKTGLAISEIMYKPAPRTDGKNLEFIELFNSTPFSQDISGYRLAGDVSFTFPPGSAMPGGGFLAIGRAPDDLKAVYGIENVAGPYQGSLKASGTVKLLSEIGAVYLEVAYSNKPPWPVGADGTGHSLVLARPSYGEGFAKAWALSEIEGGSPGKMESFQPSPLRSILINEFLARSDDPLLEYIELYNHSNDPVDVSGCILTDRTDTNKFVVPNSTFIPARGFVSFDQTQLQFSLSAAGETIYLISPDHSHLLDVVPYEAQANGISAGRVPDGAAEFYPLRERTPGRPNRAILVDDIAINEIMYSPISGNSDDQYIELYNQGNSPVSLAGWKFIAGVDFTFPSGAALSPGQYLVIARNAARLMTNYPNLNPANTLGNFKGKLSGKGERLALAKPDSIVSTNKSGLVSTNAIYIVTDEVTYEPGGHWGTWAHGGGSSLELIDPRSNHRLPSNWADSDETSKAPWTPIEATGVLDLGQGYNGGPIDSLHVVMLGESECQLDNVEVIRGINGTNVIANSTFDSGAAGWTPQGNHVRSTWDPSGVDPSGGALHIRASSRGDTGANRIMTRLTTNLTSGQTATIRAQARWLAGWPELVLRVHGNWLEAPGALAVPANLGTPGARNSRAVQNAPPAIYQVSHSPILPADKQPAVVTARVQDPDGISSLTLKYRIDPGVSYLSAPMVDDGAGIDAIAGDGIFSAQIPGNPAGTLVAFYIEAIDVRGARSTFPNDAPQRECYLRFGEPAPLTTFGVYHQWFPQSTINTWTTRPVLSNERLDGTFVYGNFRIIYNFGSRYAGSPYHQGFASPLSDGHYSIEFPLDDMLLGTDNFNKIHAPGNGPFDDDTIQREQTSFWLVRQLGLPWLYRRYVAMYVNGNRRGTLMEDTQVPGSEMIDEYFPADADGQLYKLQPWFEFDNSNSKTLGFSNNSWCYLNNYVSGGVKKLARYRWNYLKRTGIGSAHDYSNVFELIDAANTPESSGQAAALNSLIDSDEWMRTFAVEHAAGNWDAVGCQNEQNMYSYKPVNGRWTLFIWDYNIVLGNGSWTPGQNLLSVNTADGPMTRIYANPPFRRAFFQALKQLAAGPMAAVNPIVDQKFAVFQSEGIRVTSPSGIKSWINSARNSILSQVSAQDAPSFTVDQSTPIAASTNAVTLTGSAPLDVKTIRFNGFEYPVTWTSVRTWSATIPVNTPRTLLNIQGFDSQQHALSNMTASATVDYSGPIAPPAAFINEWMANNNHTLVDPADGKFHDWFELYNPASTAVNLAGYYFSDNLANPFLFRIPDGYSIPANGFLLVWADNLPDQNHPGNAGLHVPFKLSKAGASIGFYRNDGLAMDAVTFGPQKADVSEGRYPDGRDLAGALIQPTPRLPNSPPVPRFISILRDANPGAWTVTWSSIPNRTYRIEFKNDLQNASWLPFGSDLIASGPNLSTTINASASPHQFFRITLLP